MLLAVHRRRLLLGQFDVFRPHRNDHRVRPSHALARMRLDARRPPSTRRSGRSRLDRDHGAADEIGGADEVGDELVVRRARRSRAACRSARSRPSFITAISCESASASRLVVGDVDGREAELALQPLELEPHRLAQLGVEVRQRLVEQQELRLHHQRARERQPLLLAARELGRLAVGQLSSCTAVSTRMTFSRISLSRGCGCAPRAGRRRSGTRSCAARSRRTGTPCRNCAGWAGRRCPCADE